MRYRFGRSVKRLFFFLSVLLYFKILLFIFYSVPDPMYLSSWFSLQIRVGVLLSFQGAVWEPPDIVCISENPFISVCCWEILCNFLHLTRRVTCFSFPFYSVIYSVFNGNRCNELSHYGISDDSSVPICSHILQIFHSFEHNAVPIDWRKALWRLVFCWC